MSSWSFADDNTISIVISNKLETLLVYESTELSEQNKKIENEKNLEDF